MKKKILGVYLRFRFCSPTERILIELKQIQKHRKPQRLIRLKG